MQEMGIGSLVPKTHRKPRWFFSADFGDIQIPLTWVRVNHRPDWIPGKEGPQPGTIITSLDCRPGYVDIFINVFKSFYNFSDSVMKINAKSPGIASLELHWNYALDDTTLIESWKLTGIWPSNMRFSDLDHSSCLELEITWTYQDAIFQIPKELNVNNNAPIENSTS